MSKKLTQEEKDLVFGIFEQEIIRNGPEAKLRFLAGEISQSHLDWHVAHRKWLLQVKKKMLKLL